MYGRVSCKRPDVLRRLAFHNTKTMVKRSAIYRLVLAIVLMAVICICTYVISYIHDNKKRKHAIEYSDILLSINAGMHLREVCDLLGCLPGDYEISVSGKIILDNIVIIARSKMLSKCRAVQWRYARNDRVYILILYIDDDDIVHESEYHVLEKILRTDY